ncbi:MAG TPA: phosphatidate cytidylyltransferase [Steroidobacteraceae bacterium]|nr:phosphatidate cytidylyltransferase [Steroidobacteraceae bacterium]
MLRQRIITALILAALVLGAIFWLPEDITAAVITLLVLAGAWEWAAFTGLKHALGRIAYVLLIAGCIAFVWSHGTSSPRAEQLLSAALIWWVVALVWVATMPSVGNRGSAALAGILVLVPAWLALIRLHQLAPYWLLFLLLLVVATDVGAYFAGRKFGRHKLAPKVSPGKTWEGVLGGLAAAAVTAAIGTAWFKVDIAAFIAVCAVVVAASVVGDLTESLFKRHAGLKDSGTILPGHGGVLDRVDSVTAAAPIFVLGLDWLGLLR